MSTSLYDNKLKALITHALGYQAERVESFKPLSAPWGSALLGQSQGGVSADTADAGTAKEIVALIESDNHRAFAAVLLHLIRNDVQVLKLFVGGDGAERRCEIYARWCHNFGVRAEVFAAQQAPPLRVEAGVIKEVDPPEIRDDLIDLVESFGLSLVFDHGAVTIEYLGLEVGRITGTGDEQRLDVGVGAYDQGAFAVMNPGLDSTDALAKVLEQVRVARCRDAPPSPIKRMSKHRWRLSELIAEPALLGLSSLEAVESFQSRVGIEDESVALAVGVVPQEENRRVMVGSIVGIDLLSIVVMVDIALLHRCASAIVVADSKDIHSAMSQLCSIAPITFDFVVSEDL